MNFIHYLESKNLNIYDVAKLLRDSEWNTRGGDRNRQAFVRLLETVRVQGWMSSDYDSYVDNGRDGKLYAHRVATLLECDIEDII